MNLLTSSIQQPKANFHQVLFLYHFLIPHSSPVLPLQWGGRKEEEDEEGEEEEEEEEIYSSVTFTQPQATHQLPLCIIIDGEEEEEENRERRGGTFPLAN